MSAPTIVATARLAAGARMTLGNVITGTVRKPMRLLVYGVDGIGKSTLAASAESPIFIGAEDGTSTLSVARFPEPRTWAEALDAVRELERAKHEYETLVIDTLDWLEPLCWAKIVGVGRRNKDGSAIESIGDIAYGTGYSAALDDWRELCSLLDSLRHARGMQIVLIAHAWIKRFSNPEGEDFDRFQIKLNDKAQGLLREWCDAVLFATHEQYTHKPKGDKTAKAKGVSTGARVMHTQRSAAFDAKNRYNLPPVLPLDWQALREAIDAGVPAPPDTLRARIAAQLESSDDESLKTRVRAAVTAAADDAGKLSRIHNKLAAQLTIAEEDKATP